jgi:GcvH upstream region-like protein
MMNFLRKHQKKLFIVITVMIIISFTFFGTFSTLGTREVADKQIAKTFDGSPIMERELHAMVKFLSMGTNEVLKNDLMSTGLTAILAEKYFEELKGEFEERLEKTKRFSPYSHPQAPFLSAVQVWSRFIPQLPRHLEEVRQGDLSPKTFAIYCDLYLDQVAFPPEVLRRILAYQQQQYSWISPDMGLADAHHLSLFGHHSFEEWFGSRFTEILGKFIFNAAIIAEQKGYKVSLGEARADLLQTCLQTLRSVPSKQEMTFADAGEFLRMQVQMAGIDETQAAKVWKKVMLAHRLFNEVGQGVLVDSLSYHQFSSFADETATVEVYRLPEVLRIADFRTLLKLQYYLDAVAPKVKKIGDLPRQFLSAEEVEKKAPELVVSRYTLEVAKADKEEIGSRLTLKETWDFEVSDEGWTRLAAEFPMLAKGTAQSQEDRFAILEGIDPALRLKIDRSARSALIDQHPDWIDEALSKVQSSKQAVAIRSKGGGAPFEEITDTTALREFLQNSKVGEAGPLFTDRQTYYRIIVWDKPAAKQVITLSEALKEDVLDDMLDQKLQDAYADVRKKDPAPFKLDNGWKPFADARDQIGAIVYADHLKQISDKPLPLDQYCKQRFASFMEAAKKNIEAAGEESSYLKMAGHSLLDQWALVKKTEDIKRSDSTTLSKAEMFKGAEGTWSAVSMPANGDLAFFRLVKRGMGQQTVANKVSEGQRLLGMDARRLLMHQVLSKMDNGKDNGSR